MILISFLDENGHEGETTSGLIHDDELRVVYCGETYFPSNVAGTHFAFFVKVNVFRITSNFLQDSTTCSSRV